MLNKIFIMGRLTRDPELRHTQTGASVASFTLAVDRDFKDKQTGERATDFIDCVIWRQTAEFVSRYFSKGRMAVVEGRLQIRDWTDKDGNKRRSAEVVADSVYFGDSKREGGSGGQESYSGGYGGYSAPAGGFPAQPDPDVPFADLTTDDGNLPF
ncbi:single-stranded DNA-binding protein [Colidextribacter sp. OB.20]|uniref:single-stranded DNA-binding protein n=1 Tax=Colidextribacter sp. OB.20 TaxID=2304568 RepID=UPI00136A59CD|nr:single-stranded DNA-binding protein [Colidextribacter sp. OB.20]NBI10221.1 single-stranded DNA-binding protein [Colidextribacter sp. OB.20]